MSLISVPQWGGHILRLYMLEGLHLKFRIDPDIDNNSPGCSRSDMWIA